ncbi:hypothetical protein M0R19_02005 [Candidatus Pacearchaeota archaeon]|jgi:hypothetical protein|nr:hypothetical protein [Candidatus Pacearchaeota archaeon]
MGIMKEVENSLKRWPIWLGIIFLFIPGLIFKIQRGLNISNYGGSLIIILLMISLYYSFPFILLGFFYTVAARKKEPSKFNQTELLFITTFGILGYIGINLLWNILNYMGIKLNFWFIYFLFIFFGVIVLRLMRKLAIIWIKKSRKKEIK